MYNKKIKKTTKEPLTKINSGNSNKRVFGRELKNSNSQRSLYKSNSIKDFKKTSLLQKPKAKQGKKEGIKLSRNYSSNSILPSIKETNETKSIKTLPNKHSQKEKKVIELRKDPQTVPDYCDEILQFLFQSEEINTPNYDKIFEKHKQINERARGILLEWICHVHNRFKLLPETLFLAINIVDCYTEKNSFELNQYQLIGIGALLIASKYEEYYAPEIRDFIKVSNDLYTKNQILKIESLILCSLKFDILFTSANKFLDYFYQLSQHSNSSTFKKDTNDKRIYYLAEFILEITLMDVSVMSYRQSLRACASLFIARKLLKDENDYGNNIWDYNLRFKSGYTEKDLKACVREMVIFLQVILNNPTNAFKDKFTSYDYDRVALVFEHNK